MRRLMTGGVFACPEPWETVLSHGLEQRFRPEPLDAGRTPTTGFFLVCRCLDGHTRSGGDPQRLGQLAHFLFYGGG